MALNLTRQRMRRNEASFERRSKASVGKNLGTTGTKVQPKLRIGGLSDAEFVRFKQENKRR